MWNYDITIIVYGVVIRDKLYARSVIWLLCIIYLAFSNLFSVAINEKLVNKFNI